MSPVDGVTYHSHARLTICDIDPGARGCSVPVSAMGCVSSIRARKRCPLACQGWVQTLEQFRGARPTVTGLKFTGLRVWDPGTRVSWRILIFCLQNMPLLCCSWVSRCQGVQAAADSFIVGRQHDRNTIHHHEVRVTHGALLVASTSDTERSSRRAGARQQQLRATADLQSTQHFPGMPNGATGSLPCTEMFAKLCLGWQVESVTTGKTETSNGKEQFQEGKVNRHVEEIRSTIGCAVHSRYHGYKIANAVHQAKVFEPLAKCMLEHKSVYSPSEQALRSLLLDDKGLGARFVASSRPCFQRMGASLTSSKPVSFLSKTFLLIEKVC